MNKVCLSCNGHGTKSCAGCRHMASNVSENAKGQFWDASFGLPADGSVMYTAADLASVDPTVAFNQRGDYEAVKDYILDKMDIHTPNGLVKTILAVDILSETFAENIISPNEISDVRQMAEYVKQVVLDALLEEEMP